MADYDVAKAFKRIEDELISSMIANLKHHRAEETKEGIEWTQWQTEQLKALEIYKKQNKDKYSNEFTEINSNIESAIQQAYETGGMDQEIKILKAIQKGYKGYVRAFKGTATTDGNFFKVNERKLNALIEATVNDMQKAEHAVLRRAEDHYRKIIFDAQVYANSGGVTYDKAVDMATHDFLSAGIRCIEYKNGARHTISDYADMAIKTATKRAYLRGEGTKRNEWGIHTVIVNKRSNPCPLCLPFVAKILIDDVYSGGSSEDGDYPLVSTAMEMGFLHPRCKDHFTTYFEGISTPPKEQQLTQADLLQIKEQNELEKKKRFAENQQKRMKRLAKHSLDKDNKKIYSSRADEWQKKSEEISEKLNKPVEKSTEDKEYLTNVGATEENNKLKAQGVKIPTAPKTTTNKPKNAKKEAEEVAKSFGVNADYSKYDISVANAINETMQRAIDEFGSHSLDALKSIGKDAKKGREGGFDSFTGKLSLSGVSGKNALFKMGEKTRKANQRYASMGIKYFSAEGDLCVIHHEIGHAIHSSLGGSIDTAATSLDREIISFMRNRRKDTTTQVSFYAEKNNQELVAECIAQYFDGTPSEIALGIIDILKKYAKK